LLGRPNLIAADDADSWRRGIAEQWAAATKQAEDAARDVCTLMLLYIEHCRDLPPESDATASLSKFLKRVREYRRTRAEHFDLIFVVMLGIMAYSFIGGVAIGLIQAEPNPTIQGMSFSITALLTYVPAMWLASEIRATALSQSDYLRAGQDWAPPSTYAWIFAWSYAATLVLLACYNIVNGLLTAEDRNFSIINLVYYGFLREMPRALLGAAASVFITIALDGRTSMIGQRKVQLIVLHGLTLFLLFLGIEDFLSHFSKDAIDWTITALHGILPLGIGTVSTLVIFKMAEDLDNEEEDDV
jgi:hypothetical protein